jgi:CRISPR/Cas system endoribonuclease Cas6 (RAMP superfamily)
MIYEHSVTKSYYKKINNIWHFKMFLRSMKWVKSQATIDESKLIVLSPVFVVLFDLESLND